MAQDFGDDIGSSLLRFVARQVGYAFRRDRNGNSIASDWWKKHFAEAGEKPEVAESKAAEKVGREQVIVPFGTEREAAYYAQVARENGVYAAAHKDKDGNGYLSFAKEDDKAIAALAPQFKEVMVKLDERRIAETLDHAKPLDKKTIEGLTELVKYPDLPGKDAPVREQPEPTREPDDRRIDKSKSLEKHDPENHTVGIRDAAKEARESCTDFADFERRMNQLGYGLTEDVKGEVMVYEPASLNQDGTLPPYDRERDWAVSATTLGNDTYKLDVTHKWFEQNTPRDVPAPAEVTERAKAQEMVATNGAMDADGRTPDPESGIKSHDSEDTNPQTATMEVEQTGSDIRPSEIYEEEQESVMDSVHEMRGSSSQLESESKDARTERESHAPAIPGEDAK